jgi:hypothetical protein
MWSYAERRGERRAGMMLDSGATTMARPFHLELGIAAVTRNHSSVRA